MLSILSELLPITRHYAPLPLNVFLSDPRQSDSLVEFLRLPSISCHWSFLSASYWSSFNGRASSEMFALVLLRSFLFLPIALLSGFYLFKLRRH